MRMKINRKKWAAIGTLTLCVVVLSGALGFLYAQHDEKEKLIDNGRNNPKVIVQGINNEGVNQENGKTGVGASNPGTTDETTKLEPPDRETRFDTAGRQAEDDASRRQTKTTPPAAKPDITPPADKPKVTTPVKPHTGKPPVSKDKKKGVPDKDNPFLNGGTGNIKESKGSDYYQDGVPAGQGDKF